MPYGFDSMSSQPRRKRKFAKGPVLRSRQVRAILDQVDERDPRKRLRVADACRQMAKLFLLGKMAKGDAEYLAEKRVGAIRNWGQELLDEFEDKEADENPVDEDPADKDPADEDLVDPTDPMWEEDPPVEDPPVEDPPVEDPPVEDPPVEDPAGEDPPVEDPPVEDPAGENGK